MKQRRAVLFDVDGVLLDSTAANIAFYRELFRQIGDIIPTNEDLAANNHVSMEGMLRRFYPDRSDQTIHDWIQLGDRIDTGLELLRPMPGVLEVIPRLAKQYHLGLATNRTLAAVEELWKVVPLAKYFTAISAYETTEHHKPDPEPLLHALEVLGVQPLEAAFVGDAETDLEAGLAAGVDVIILGQEQWPGAKETISSLTELPLVLAR